MTKANRSNQRLVALIGLAIIGIALASALGYWVTRIGLKPLIKLSEEAQKLAPPRLSGRLQLSPLPPELSQSVCIFNSTLERVEHAYSRLELFNADVAHELRSPLTNLIGQTQVALTRGRLPSIISRSCNRTSKSSNACVRSSTTCCSWPVPTRAARPPS